MFFGLDQMFILLNQSFKKMSKAAQSHHVQGVCSLQTQQEIIKVCIIFPFNLSVRKVSQPGCACGNYQPHIAADGIPAEGSPLSVA